MDLYWRLLELEGRGGVEVCSEHGNFRRQLFIPQRTALHDLLLLLLVFCFDSVLARWPAVEPRFGLVQD